MHISLLHFLALALLIFLLGLSGLFIKTQHFLSIIISLELMILAPTMLFSIAANYLNDSGGHVFSLFILAVSAAEVAIGLAMLVLYHRNNGNIDADKANRLG